MGELLKAAQTAYDDIEVYLTDTVAGDEHAAIDWQLAFRKTSKILSNALSKAKGQDNESEE